MKAFNRTNRLGLRYTLVETPDPHKTQIQLHHGGNKTYESIVVNHPIVLLQKSWDKWKDGELLQNAFPYLTATEREFILTGISDEAWDSMFAD